MEKDRFIELLKSEKELSIDTKLEICQYFIDNYPVLISTQVSFSTKHKMWTKLITKIEGGSEKSINFAIQQLKKRIKEFEKWN